MAKAVKCDRCGRFFEYYNVKVSAGEATTIGFNAIVQGSYTVHDGYFYKKTYDLCTDCCREFDEWLKEAEE